MHSLLSFEISPAVQKKLIQLGEKIARKFGTLINQPPGALDYIHRHARISMIGASTRIENAILTDSEINWMDTILGSEGKNTSFDSHRIQIENKLSKDRERSIEEVAGCRAMLLIIYEQSSDFFPLTESLLRGLHRELTRYYPPAEHYSGKYKIQSNSVAETNHLTGKQRIIFKTAEPGPITASAMNDLLTWYNQALLQEPWSIAVACELVFRFLAIHPFQDGNGRLGRGLFLMSLLHSPHQSLAQMARYLAIDRQIEKHKEEYYSVLNRCSKGKFLAKSKEYHIEYFLNFMIKVIEESLNDVEIYQNRYQLSQKFSIATVKVLECFKEMPEITLQTKDICATTNIPRRTVINSLNTLVKNGLIQINGSGPGIRYKLVF